MYNLHISLKSLTRENAKIKSTNDLLLERNSLLENELLTLEKCKKECQIAKDELILSLKREEAGLRSIWIKNKKLLANGLKSEKVSEQIRSVQGKTNFLDPDYVDVQSVASESTNNSSTDMDHPSTSKRSMDVNYQLIKNKTNQEKKLVKLKNKYGHINNFVKQKEQIVEAKTNNQQVNVIYLSIKQLKDKLENIEAKTVPITKKKKNRNGKVGINKNNNYTPDKHAHRKVCSKCGSSNHLAMQCKIIVPPVFSQSMHANVDQNFSDFAQMPFLPYPYYLYGNASMTHMLRGTPIICNSFAYTYPENAS